MKILLCTGARDFDPSEVAIPWLVLRKAGFEIAFATDTGQAGVADARMLDGNGFGILKPLLIARKDARDAYHELRKDAAFRTPMKYSDIQVGEHAGLVLPGGHAKGMIPFLESAELQNAISGFFAAGKPVGAICHGVVAACRAKDVKTGRSVLYGRKTTALLKSQEMLAYRLTRRKLGDYYRTYPQTVEDEVKQTLRTPEDFIHGPTPLRRDSPRHLSAGFTVRDGNYLSARWPGDAYRFANDFIDMVEQK